MKKFVSPVDTLELSRTVRRTLVVLMYGVYSGLTLFWGRANDLTNSQFGTARWLTLAGLAVFAFGYLALNLFDAPRR